jgi:8-amino-3,8-dideoxy-alpha-D-manno-octulosonate transaminase
LPGFEFINKKELDEIKDIFKNGGVLFRHGFEKLRNNTYKVSQFEKNFTKKFSSNYSLAVTSGTAALRVALASLDLSKDDEIITQSFTFVATVEAIIESSAIPVCTEIDETLNMDPDDLIKKISKKTKAVIVVHMLGVPANLDKIKRICKKKKIFLIEDTAWGIGGKYKNNYLGTIGDMGTFSFDYAKSITTGEGGMVTFKNKKHYLKAKAWHDHGHENNPNVPRWEDTRSTSGFNYRMTELQGAVGIIQLKKLNRVINLQRKNAHLIWNKLKNFSDIKLRNFPKDSYVTYDSLVLVMKNSKLAKKFRYNLVKNGLNTKILPEAMTWHFAKFWTHMKKLSIAHNNGLNKSFPKSEKLLNKCVSIPINCMMNKNIPNIVKKSLIETLSLKIIK